MDLGEALQTLTPRLIAYGVARTGSLATAEDVAQEVLLALIRRWQQLGPPASPAAFVFAIAKRRVRRVLARRALRVPIEVLRGFAAAGPTVEDAYVTRTELRRALSDLRALPHRDREALLLRVIGELSYEEVASVCGSSVGAIKMRVSRARRRLTGFQQEPINGQRRQPV
jgi:RNA polymerase sigma-70 factor (ECF subfamily)